MNRGGSDVLEHMKKKCQTQDSSTNSQVAYYIVVLKWTALSGADLKANLCLIRKCGRKLCMEGVTQLRRIRRHAEAKISSVLHRRVPPQIV